MIDGINIIGPVFGELGIGEDVRTLAEALCSLDIPIAIFNYPDKIPTRQGDRTFEKYVVEDLVYGYSIFCLPAIEMLRFVLQYGPEPLVSRYTIGYWPWELHTWPQQFAFVQEYVREIWASSRFALDCYRHAFTKPVHHIPLILKPASVEKSPGTDAIVDLSSRAFKFLFVFDANSTVERKNPQGLIRAFHQAFGDSKEVELVLKTMNYDAGHSEFNALIETADNIVLINEAYSKHQITALYEATDAYVSLHRSEGFGRTIAEAMLAQSAAVVSDYSGSQDFCTENNSFLVPGELVDVKPYSYLFWRGARWFEPSISAATAALAECFRNEALREDKKANAYRYILENFSTEAVAKKILSRLEKIPA